MPANAISPAVFERYLRQLRADEERLLERANTFANAKADLDVELKRYQALRDHVTDYLGESPYNPQISWPEPSPEEVDDWLNGDDRTPPLGQFRFTGLSVGDAVVQVLEETAQRVKLSSYESEWLSLEQIITKLSEGGFGIPEPVQARAINGAIQALFKGQRIRKGKRMPDGLVIYAYRQVDLDEDSDDDDDDVEEVTSGGPDSLPF